MRITYEFRFPAGERRFAEKPIAADERPLKGRGDERPLVDIAAVRSLYASVGWAAYLTDPALLPAALDGSRWVGLAEDEDLEPGDPDRLVGLCRVVGDGVTIAYVQDLLVRPNARRRGVARTLVESALVEFRGVRQTVLLTDLDAGIEAFYRAVGFDRAADKGVQAFVALRG